jgi:hypothetical protein
MYVNLCVYCFRYDTNKICCNAHPDAPLIEDYRAGDQICSECGLVVGDRLVKLILPNPSIILGHRL